MRTAERVAGQVRQKLVLVKGLKFDAWATIRIRPLPASRRRRRRRGRTSRCPSSRGSRPRSTSGSGGRTSPSGSPSTATRPTRPALGVSYAKQATYVTPALVSREGSACADVHLVHVPRHADDPGQQRRADHGRRREACLGRFSNGAACRAKHAEQHPRSPQPSRLPALTSRTTRAPVPLGLTYPIYEEGAPRRRPGDREARPRRLGHAAGALPARGRQDVRARRHRDRPARAPDGDQAHARRDALTRASANRLHPTKSASAPIREERARTRRCDPGVRRALRRWSE